MLKEVLLVAALAVIAVAQVESNCTCEYDWVERDEFESVRREVSWINGALEACQNTIAYTLELLVQNSDNCGERSYASGERSYASGERSYASGERSYASGERSYASGERSYASGERSYASGERSYASGERSYASRERSFVSGERSDCEELREDIINETLKAIAVLLELQTQQLLQQLLRELSSYPKGSIQNPAASCMEIAESSNCYSGYYWLLTPSGGLQNVYCTSTGWMRVAYLNMTDHYQTCPQGFKQFNSPKRACGRTLNTSGCNSVTFPVHGVSYRNVSGQILGYQLGSPSGFYTPRTGNTTGDAYLDGVSVTYGQSPREHIWSFANALQEAAGYHDQHICPCTNPASTMQQYIPDFVGNDYFCDAGTNTTGDPGEFYPDDPLWDGHGCGLQSTCCTFNNPPYFNKELPQDSTEDIEVRICADEENDNEDSPVELIELYVL